MTTFSQFHPDDARPAPSTPALTVMSPEAACIAQLRGRLDHALTQGELRATLLQDALSRFSASADLAQLLARCGPPQAGSYRRHLLAADAQGRYSVVAIVWGPEQFSPVHGHHTWCAYSVLCGALYETRYNWCEPSQQAHASRAATRRPGEVCYTEAGPCGIHRLGNPHAQPAISLHIYGVPAARVATDVNQLVTAAG